MEQVYFYILFIVALPAIAGLAMAVVYYRRKLDRCMIALTRCINENIEMKQKLFKLHSDYIPYPTDLTPREFTRIVHNMLKRLMFLPLFFLFVVSNVHAGEKPDTIYTFRFVPDEDMFYVPWGGNDKELARLKTCIDTYKNRIISGEIPLYVDGYCKSKESEVANLAVAKIRSNRVKSELITRQKLTEACFVTNNHSDSGDYVTVRLVVPIYNKVKEIPADEPKDTTVMAVARQPEAVESAETVAGPPVADTIQTAQSVPVATVETEAAKPYTLFLRANLLRWATLTPDLGLEWRINRHVGILVNGSWTSWSWDDKNRRYALWEVSPEVRYYIGKEKRGYIGAMYHAGQFNYKLNETGKQGDLMGGGMTGGYSLKLNRLLSMDFSLGVGCTHADYEKYTVTDGVRVRQSKEKKNYWGVNHAGITLVWKLK